MPATGSLEWIVAALEAARIRYLIVGGVAVVLHGHLRTTADIDLVLQLRPENVTRALAVLASLGFRPRAPVELEGFADAGTREGWITEKGLQVFSLWNPSAPAFEMDLFVREPFDFDEAWARRADVALDEVIARVAGIDDLIRLKRAAGRAEDLRDIEALEALRDAGGGK